jgi:hypothetical protein
MKGLPEDHRQALLRFAEFESKNLEKADDTTIMMIQLSLYKLFERDPDRVIRIIGAALTIYGAESAPWEKSS